MSPVNPFPDPALSENPVHCQQSAAEAAEYVKILCLSQNPDTALMHVLKRLCVFLSAERSYFYRYIDRQWIVRHEWSPYAPDSCGSYEPHKSADHPADLKNSESFIFPATESLKEICPSFYSILADRCVAGAVIILFRNDRTITGCLGADNPDPAFFDCILPVLQALGTSVSAAYRMAADAQTIQYLRLHDSMTGVYKREVYLKELESFSPLPKPAGIIRFRFLDMDRIRECYGYTYGDGLILKCLKTVSLMSAAYGTLYQTDCNEFAVLCLEPAREPFEILATELGPVLEESVHCPVAVGYQWSLRPGDLRQLDLSALSMLEEEKRYHERSKVLSEQHHVIEEDPYGMLTMDGVCSLIETGRFVVYLQPKLYFQTGALAGAEALVRFLDDDEAVLEPGRFLPDLERAMLIRYVDLYIFESSCRLLQSWTRIYPVNPVPVSVNFSKMTLEEPGLVSRLVHMCRKYDVKPEWLEVEITGSADKLQTGHLSRIVDKIRAAGFVISVDDFGIRFANLSLLVSLDCDKLKVDRSLVENVTTSPKAQSVLKALASLATATGTQTTVEGIETEEQLHMLKNMGFDEMQGFLISQPLTVRDFEMKYLI